MEQLRRGGHVRHAHVVFGAQLQETFDAGRGVLGALALVAMREQQHQPRRLVPLDLGGGQELVDDDLGPVYEIAELSFPGHQGVRAKTASNRTRSRARRTRTAASRRRRTGRRHRRAVAPYLPAG